MFLANKFLERMRPHARSQRRRCIRAFASFAFFACKQVPHGGKYLWEAQAASLHFRQPVEKILVGKLPALPRSFRSNGYPDVLILCLERFAQITYVAKKGTIGERRIFL